MDILSTIKHFFHEFITIGIINHYRRYSLVQLTVGKPCLPYLFSLYLVYSLSSLFFLNIRSLTFWILSITGLTLMSLLSSSPNLFYHNFLHFLSHSLVFSLQPTFVFQFHINSLGFNLQHEITLALLLSFPLLRLVPPFYSFGDSFQHVAV